MAFSDWDELRTAYHVARLGTVSGAAQVLGVHHATVIRHIDSLEQKLGAKLFQRHPRGYTPTEAGLDVLKVAQATEDQFNQLASRIKGRGDAMTGDLNITSLSVLAPLLIPALAAFQEFHPGLRVNFLTDERLFRLEYGEAHVAIRAGNPPQEPDNIVQKFHSQGFTLYAAASYAEQHGLPDNLDDVGTHRFIGTTDETVRAPFLKWLHQNIPAANICFRANQVSAQHAAICAGVGIGFSTSITEAPATELIQICPPRPEWRSELWLVSHVDLHRTPKVQAVLTFLKDWAKRWPKD